MKQSTIFSRMLMLGLILILVLVACERPTDGATNVKETEEAAGAVESTAVPVTPVSPTVESATAVPETVVDPTTEAPVGENPEGDNTESETPANGDPTPVPGAVGGDPATDPQAGGGDGTSTNPAPVPPGGTYTVSAGENFFRIGLNHGGCSVGQMAAVNPAVVPPYYTIYVGQVLTIPSCP